jgi:predicted outer membrane protein
MHGPTLRLAILLSGIAPLTVACSSADGTDPDVQDRREAGELRGQELADQLTGDLEGHQDTATANIASVVRSANEGEIQQAKLALQRGRDAEVSSFAERMVDVHETSNDDLDQVLADLSIDQEPNRTAAALAADAIRGYTELNVARAGDFDREYMLLQVQMHAEVLQIADAAEELTPEANVRAFLTDLRITVEAHLDEAIDLAEAL